MCLSTLAELNNKPQTSTDRLTMLANVLLSERDLTNATSVELVEGTFVNDLYCGIVKVDSIDEYCHNVGDMVEEDDIHVGHALRFTNMPVGPTDFVETYYVNVRTDAHYETRINRLAELNAPESILLNERFNDRMSKAALKEIK